MIVALSKQDVVTNYDHRISTTAIQIDVSGFTTKVSTWNDSGIYGVCVTWFAFDDDFIKNPQDDNAKRVQCGRLPIRKTLPGYSLNKGKGDRKYLNNIIFDKAFSSPPLVFVAISSLNVLNSKDLRISVISENILNTGFDLTVLTWADTIIFSCDISWIAFEKSFSSSPSDSDFLIQIGRHPFKKTQPNYSLLNGNGSRDMKQKIKFSKKYSGIPSVAVCLCQLDVLSDFDHRISTVAENITPSDFDLKMSTWKDSRIWSASASWIAFGKPEVSSDPSIEENLNGQLNKKLKKETNQDEQKECKICFDNEINTVLIPCGHLCVCEDCSHSLKTVGQSLLCPICKSKVQKIVKTYTT